MKSVSDFLKNVLYLALLAFFAFDAFVLATLFAPDLVIDNPYTHLVTENQDILVAIFALQTFDLGMVTLEGSARYEHQQVSSNEVGISRSAQWCGDGRPCGFDTFWDLLTGNDNDDKGKGKAVSRATWGFSVFLCLVNV